MSTCILGPIIIRALWKAQLAKPNAHKEGIKEGIAFTEEMPQAMQWMFSSRLNNTIALAFDGRSKEVRKKLEAIIENNVTDSQRHLDLGVTYRAPQSNDIRFPKRETFAGFNNRENFIGALPISRIRMRSKPRGHYSACGESSTFTMSYSDVHIRSLQSLPRVTLPNKEEMMNIKMPALPEEVLQFAGTRGHPIFWNEFADIDLYEALFKDLSCDFVWDLTPGTSAASCAAARLGITYEGIASTEKHANWLNNIMDKAIFAIVSESENAADAELHADLNKYFLHVIEEGRLFLRAPTTEEDNTLPILENESGEDEAN